MDNYENDFFAENAQEQIPLPYKVKPKRKRSPYENSDYITPFQTQSVPAPAAVAEPAGIPTPEPIGVPEQIPLPYKIPEAPKKKTRSAWKFWRAFICIFLVLTLVAGSCVATAILVESRLNKQHAKDMERLEKRIQQELEKKTSDFQTGMVAPTQDTLTPHQVYAKNIGAVVSISNYGYTDKNGQTYQQLTSGSGFIITEDGYVVSNYHVVGNASKLTVITADGTEYEAELVGYNADNDISLLKVDMENLPHVTIGSSDDVLVGDQVVAIGNALGELSSTLTVGYISAKDRIVTTEGTTLNMLQTDAAINAGNSGGPLLNMKGEVIGITTAKFSGTSSSGASIEGIGFAIPIDDVMGMLEDIKELGYVNGAYLGVMVKDVDETAQSYGLPAGAYVDEVVKGCAAERAGLQAQDIIIDLGGHEVQSVADLTRILRKFEPGETVSITVYRKSQTLKLSITLDEKPAEDATQQPNDQKPQTQDPQTQTPDQDFDFWNEFDPFGFFSPFFP